MPFARKRLRAKDRRRSILDEARRLFAKTGFHGVSVDEIARRVKVSPAILYRHFPSKEALYDAVLEEMSCRREEYVEAIIAEDANFASVLRRITQLYVRGVCREPDYLRMELQAALEGNSTAAQFFENRWKPFIDFVEIEVNELKAAGRVPATLDPRVAGLLYQGLVREALYAKCMLKDQRLKDIPPETIVDQALELFFRALGIAADR